MTSYLTVEGVDRRLKLSHHPGSKLKRSCRFVKRVGSVLVDLVTGYRVQLAGHAGQGDEHRIGAFASTPGQLENVIKCVYKLVVLPTSVGTSDSKKGSNSVRSLAPLLEKISGLVSSFNDFPTVRISEIIGVCCSMIFARLINISSTSVKGAAHCSNTTVSV